MCPSYRVTLDEQHLTRGRANTLRLALSGQLGKDAFTGAAVRDTMDLCVSCKGCRRECPTGVDMARMKVEFLAHYKATHGYTVRDRLIAHLPDYAAAAGRFAWLLNLRDRIPGAAWLSEKCTGLAARRPWPQWRADSFFASGERQLFASAQEVLAQPARGVVLFVDTFNGLFESEIAYAAARVLGAAGYAVHTLRRDKGHFCCGRTFLSVGMVEQAKARAGELLDALLPFARAGVPIVGLEPSCLLSLRDEALVMRLGERAAIVARQALLFEEFIVREVRAGGFTLELNPADAPIALHGHCHQKAFGAMDSILSVLALIPGANVRAIEGSCCGMAGAFGYEAEHYALSMRMGELSLLPAVRTDSSAIVVADGTSCRRQILDGAQRQALHVAVLLDRLRKRAS